MEIRLCWQVRRIKNIIDLLDGGQRRRDEMHWTDMHQEEVRHYMHIGNMFHQDVQQIHIHMEIVVIRYERWLMVKVIIKLIHQQIIVIEV